MPVEFWDGTATAPGATLRAMPEATDTAQPFDTAAGHRAASTRRSMAAE